MAPNRSLTRRGALQLGVMCAASAAAYIMTPRQYIAALHKLPDLNKAIPDQFGRWTANDLIRPIVADPSVQSQLSELYTQTFAKTYTDAQGNGVMLTIAYGGNQNKELQIHRPEVCYAAQGFNVSGLKKGEVNANGQIIPVMRMVATRANRIEPITYWIKVGDKIVRGNLELGLARASYGMKGLIADALLVRVSSLSPDLDDSFRKQGEFINELISFLSKSTLGTPLLTA